MKVDEGRNICRTDSALHLLRTPRVVGRAGERSRAGKEPVRGAIINESIYHSYSTSTADYNRIST